jgi:arginase
MSRFAIIQAPSALGLFPEGVERLPEALLAAGLQNAIQGRLADRLEPPASKQERDPDTLLRNGPAIRQYSFDLARSVGEVVDGGELPLVLGGDCSILLGSMLALRRRGRYGLLFLDGHADFYQPKAEPNGEVASMELALATGRGPEMLANLDGDGPLVREDDVVAFGRRDHAEAEEAGSQLIEETAIEVIGLDDIRRDGLESCLNRVRRTLTRSELDGFFVHVDCDVLDDALFPAVDYRLPGGLLWPELELTLASAIGHSGLAGLEVTIFNPSLDEDGRLARQLVACLASALDGAA